MLFLSTLSLRRATAPDPAALVQAPKFLSTLSLRRATLLHRYTAQGRKVISIHALLAESDAHQYRRERITEVFLSTLSLRRATRTLPALPLPIEISIHALLAESDSAHQCARPSSAPFLSTLSLRRATPVHLFWQCTRRDFYPRSPCGERLRHAQRIAPIHAISIHALLAESDGKRDCGKIIAGQFLSTLSLRRATAPCRHHSPHRTISIHALLAESDYWQKESKLYGALFLSTLSLRRATVWDV